MDRRKEYRNEIHGLAAAVVCLCGVLSAVAAPADSFREQLKYGNALLNSGDFEGAREVYRGLQLEHPESEIVYYSLGCADYEEGAGAVALQDPEGAIEFFSSARDAFQRAKTSRDKSLRIDASYNHANAMAQIAKQTASLGDNKATITAFEETVAAYEGVLERYPDHKQARHNLDHVRYLLKRMLQVPPPDEEQQEGEQGGQQEQQQDSQEQQNGDQQQDQQEQQDDQGEKDGQEDSDQQGSQQPEQEEGAPQQESKQQTGASATLEEEPGEGDREERQDRQTIEAILQSLESQDKREQQDLRTSQPDSHVRKEWW
ncbi:MAG TPA: hypothetical protein PKW60_08810 [Candidatus Hydrogenedentes bacterium]|nr:hypothetical protein [Candidatus Hydrogenedentota bacterium]